MAPTLAPRDRLLIRVIASGPPSLGTLADCIIALSTAERGWRGITRAAQSTDRGTGPGFSRTHAGGFTGATSIPERDAKPGSQSTGGAMIILHQEMRAKPEKSDEVMAALAAIIPGARATKGVIKLDIARDLLDPDSFVATGVYEDGAALERQESAPEVHRAMAMFADSLAAPPDRRIYDASRDPTLV